MESLPTTDEKWAALIRTTANWLPKTFEKQPAPVPSAINRAIDHTLLDVSATESQIDALCDQAKEYQFASVCVRLPHVERAVQNLKDTPEIGVACVVGFHEGTCRTSEKEHEAREAERLGASELDMVLNHPLLKQGKYTEVYEDVLAVRRAAPSPVKLKVILETSQLDRFFIIAGSVLSCMAGADYIKTSTGFNGPGASEENVALMRATADLVRKGCKVKASGGVRTAEVCIRMLKAGADRIGTSSGVKIMRELNDTEKSEQDLSQGNY